MSECKEHGTIYVEYGGNIGAPSDGYCYQCEIDRLKAELEAHGKPYCNPYTGKTVDTKICNCKACTLAREVLK